MGSFPNPPLAPEDIAPGHALRLNANGDGWEVFIPNQGIGQQTLSFFYGDSDTEFDFPCWGIPANWDATEGQGSIGSVIEVGPSGNIPSGVLEDSNGDPIPDTWIMPVVLFVEGNRIYDIIAFNPYIFGAACGIISWGADGGTPQAVQIGPIVTPAIDGGNLQMPNLPASNPHVAGQLWSNSGVLTVSSG